MEQLNFLFGMIAMQLLFLLVFFLVFKKREFIFFLFFALGVSSFVYLMIQSKDFFLSLGKSYEELLSLSFGILIISLGFYYVYSRFLVNAPEKHPSFNKVLIWSARVAFLTGSIFLFKSFFYAELKYAALLGKIFFISNILLQIYIIIYLIRAGGLTNLLHLVGSVVMSVYFKIFIIPIVFSDYSYKNYSDEVPRMLLGVVLNFMFFNFIMIYNYRRIEQEKFALKIQKNEELEMQRREISNDLHDDMGAVLSGLQVYAGIAIKEINAGGGKTLYFLDKVSTGVKDAMNNLGDVIWAVRNDQNNDKSFSGRIKDFFMDVFDARNIESVYEIDVDVEASITGMLSRKNLILVAKEVINNAIKHSDASIINISLNRLDNNLRLVISDNGQGFDTSIILPSIRFSSIRDRVSKLDGNLIIQSSPGSGTKVECIIPLPIIRDR